MQVIGAPLAAALLALDGYLGLAGWQWLFIVEGIPTVLMGLYTKANLAESPAKASFLTAAEKALLQQRHAENKVSCSNHASPCDCCSSFLPLMKHAIYRDCCLLLLFACFVGSQALLKSV